jgi:hypothetical protein
MPRQYALDDAEANKSGDILALEIPKLRVL